MGSDTVRQKHPTWLRHAWRHQQDENCHNLLSTMNQHHCRCRSEIRSFCPRFFEGRRRHYQSLNAKYLLENADWVQVKYWQPLLASNCGAAAVAAAAAAAAVFQLLLTLPPLYDKNNYLFWDCYGILYHSIIRRWLCNTDKSIWCQIQSSNIDEMSDFTRRSSLYIFYDNATRRIVVKTRSGKQVRSDERSASRRSQLPTCKSIRNNWPTVFGWADSSRATQSKIYVTATRSGHKN